MAYMMRLEEILDLSLDFFMNGILKLTMPGTPQQNGVAEMRNHTLLEMPL